MHTTPDAAEANLTMRISAPGFPPGNRSETDTLADRIGPNAITQLEAVLVERIGRRETARIFADAGVAHYLEQPPSDMVAERDVASLHHEVRRTAPQAREILREAGDRTGRYILARRIPRPVVFALRRLPAPLSARLLTRAIGQHAWTFAGSGSFEMHHAPERIIAARIARNPVVALDTSAEPICAWHAAVFQRLFRELIDPAMAVDETDCCAAGAPACRFRIRPG